MRAARCLVRKRGFQKQHGVLGLSVCLSVSIGFFAGGDLLLFVLLGGSAV